MVVTKCDSKADFDKCLKESGGKLVVVDFFATWCGPCKMIAPKVEKLSGELNDVVVFLKVDVDECQELAEEYEISAMPTFVFIKDGAKVHVMMGANFEELKAKIKEHQ